MTLVLTGIAEETDFVTKATQFLLVFNHGLLRVPVDQDAISAILAIQFGAGNGAGEGGFRPENEPVTPASENVSSTGEVYGGETDDNGVGQL